MKKIISFAAFVMTVAFMFSLMTQVVFAANVDFETFVVSVKAGEFDLPGAVYGDFIGKIESGDTDGAMAIYESYFAGEYHMANIIEDAAEQGIDIQDITEALPVEAEDNQDVAVEPEVAAVESLVATAEQEAVEVIDVVEDEPEPEVVIPAPVAQPVVTEVVSVADTRGLSQEDYTALCKMVQAESGSEDENGRLMVANVILTRVKSAVWPNSVCAVISQPGQFSPYRNGRYSVAQPDAMTISAVNRALDGENNAVGIHYFKSVRSRQNWSHKIFAGQYGNHLFYY